MHESASIQDVADAAGVSKTTVSHVLSGNRPVSPATRRRVERAMRELGYRPNFFARALNSRRSHTVALLAEDITNPFYPALARGLQTAISGADEVVMLFDSKVGAPLTDTVVGEMIRRRVDGAVIASTVSEANLVDLRAAGIPVVLIGWQMSTNAVDRVSADDRQIARDAVGYLHARGHTRIGFISGPLAAEPGSSRHAGFVEAMRSLGLRVDDGWLVAGDWGRESGKRAMTSILAGGAPSAVFCANDLMAIGALDAAFEAGVDVPGSIAVIGADDIDAACLVRPALTTVKIPAEEIGRAAGDLLLRRIDEPDAAPRRVLVEHTVVSRESA